MTTFTHRATARDCPYTIISIPDPATRCTGTPCGCPRAITTVVLRATARVAPYGIISISDLPHIPRKTPFQIAKQRLPAGFDIVLDAGYS